MYGGKAATKDYRRSDEKEFIRIMDFLNHLDFKKSKIRVCNRCNVSVKLSDGEIFCKKCRPKIKKMDTDTHIINVYGGESG